MFEWLPPSDTGMMCVDFVDVTMPSTDSVNKSYFTSNGNLLTYNGSG